MIFSHHLAIGGLTGLAQRRVVKITPIKGVIVIIFEVNFGKNSFAKTVKHSASTISINLEVSKNRTSSKQLMTPCWIVNQTCRKTNVESYLQ